MANLRPVNGRGGYGKGAKVGKTSHGHNPTSWPSSADCAAHHPCAFVPLSILSSHGQGIPVAHYIAFSYRIFR